MPLWSFPAVVRQIITEPFLAASVTIDLGCRLYTDTVIRIAGVVGINDNADRLTRLLPAGTPVVATCPPPTGDTIRAHLTLADGRDVASVIKARKLPATPAPVYGSTSGKSWTYPAFVEKVTDGDTFHAAVDLGGIVYRTVIRVAHVNAPEKATPEGLAALVWATGVLTSGLPITLTTTKLEKYGRLLATASLPDGHDFGTELVTAGHAVPYEGGAR